MKCKEGDLAVIKFSIRQENIGRIVKVAEHIGRYEAGTLFQYRGMPCQAAVTDNYWWIEAEDLSIMLGPSPRAYIPDSWLEPIKPPKEKDQEKEALELDIFGMSIV